MNIKVALRYDPQDFGSFFVQLQSESNPALNTVTAYGDDYIEINEISYGHAVYFAPEVLLIGTGLKQHMLPAAVTRPLLDIGIGVEVMSTQAAARTYNILMAEGRRVVAALLPLKETA